MRATTRPLRLRNAGLALVATGLLGPVLAACGDDDPYAAYCDEVVDQRPTISEAIAAGGSTGLLDALPSFEALQERAPEDVAPDWSVVVNRVRDLAEALDAAGVEPSTYDPDDPPADLGDAARTRIESAASQLLNPLTGAALATVQQQVRDVCGTPLTQ